MKKPAQRSQEIQPFQVMAILAQAQAMQAEGHDVIHLEVGEPDFTTAEPMVNAAISAMQAGHTKYTPALGLPQLRERIADYYQQRFGVSINPQRIVLTPGASGALLLLSAARLDVNDKLLLADPGYPCNRHFARTFEAHGQLVPAGPEDRYQLTPSLIRQHWQADTKVALVASPANPTGTVLSLDEMQALADEVRQQRAQHGQGELWVDEIYQGLNYNSEPQTVLSVADDAVVLNSFSKFFGMTGWRLGWCVVPESWVPTMDTLAQNLFLAPPTPAQYAALAAFDDDAMAIYEQRRQELQQRRDYLLTALPQLGFNIPVIPEGAFYIYADASRFTDNSLEFCAEALKATGVAFTPGVDFGEYQANTHVRFAFTTNLSRLKQAVERLADWLAERS
ncbi:pyridoxal phosphate-dependent aminotransferase [Bacterioplanoides sp. SCSIO 12839]|uniref:pyridoxal phosphate-dependent aminotransferase n=1 Tax=Bacterioplanoides sp. SCSIO 12839 TaxID=2829569 RepID=UPI00210453D9|nr:pyridoxal phosphate-dependent aminotransferase [Bacterioplanoides sp. SCSIO 12839]UTW48798.1 pyridoxal phosphate-dependent aminotransferase [Bacterioplanoides sp. SCSIO 12839]